MTGIKLDIGCGNKKPDGYTGMDMRPGPQVDIVHDVRRIPWPLPDESCLIVLMNHVMEHISPEYSFEVMDELWRIIKPEGQLLIVMPYAGSDRFWQDPSHVHAWTLESVKYFDPVEELYQVYKPKPWKIGKNIRDEETGDLQLLMGKRTFANAG